MFEQSLDKLGQWPILQFFGGIMILAGVAYMIFRGERDKAQPPHERSEVRLFFDGPLLKALELLEGIYRVLREIRAENKEAARDAEAQHKEMMSELRRVTDRLR
jgi:hypothetical protein